jgi:hypothetical protein
LSTLRLSRLAVLTSLVLAVLAALAVAPAAQAATPSLVLVPREATARPPQNVAAADLIGAQLFDLYYEGVYRGYIDLYVYSDHRKRLIVCDQNGDYREPGLQVDPSTDEPVLYQDLNGSHSGCLEHDIWYSVRKFRYGFHEEGDGTVALWWGPWFNVPPLPYPDF